jgi:hypothetical protein
MNKLYKKCAAFLIIAVIFGMVQGCILLNVGAGLTGHVDDIQYRHVSLNENSSISGIGTTISMSKDNIEIDYTADISKYIFNNIDFSHWGVSSGINVKWRYSTSRLQPYIGIEGNIAVTKGCFLSVIPNIGLRCYLTDKVSIFSGVGYRFGVLLFVDDEQHLYYGYAPTIGIGLGLTIFK